MLSEYTEAMDLTNVLCDGAAPERRPRPQRQGLNQWPKAARISENVDAISAAPIEWPN
jgi:hypothetical protein